ncbi:MAG: hypothetical protein JO359_12870 [Candidatus Eremiobacteraeota bacterium]|nr:hypothetical protein [Candidatus Eremiobacteraeota bacterium]
MPEFTSLATLLRPSPPISPLIAEPKPPPLRQRSDRLDAARAEERFEERLQILLREIACEVLGRELVLSPPALEEIVERLRRRYPLQAAGIVRTAPNGDCSIDSDDGLLDASLGRRLAAALDRST